VIVNSELEVFVYIFYILTIPMLPMVSEQTFCKVIKLPGSLGMFENF